LRVPRPSSSAVLPFIVCAVFLIVRAMVVIGLAVVR
jgi:hypothetical protein